MQPLGAGKPLGMFSSRISTPRWRAKMRSSSSAVKAGVDLALVELLAADAEVLDQVAERNRLGDLQRALDLVHHAGCAWPSPGSVMVMTDCGPERPQTSSVYIGECRSAELQLRIAEPVAEFGDLRLVAIVQMLAGAEDLDRGDAGVPDAVEPDGSSAGG